MNEQGGETIVYVAESLKTHRRPDLKGDGIEYIWIEVMFSMSKSLPMGNVYRPPDTSVYFLVDFNEKF